MKAEVLLTLSVPIVSVGASIALWSMVSPISALIAPAFGVPLVVVTALNHHNVRNLAWFMLAAQGLALGILAA